MALIKTGLDIEINGVTDAINNLKLLDDIQVKLATTSDTLILNISGINKVFANIGTNVGIFNKAAQPAVFANYAQAAQNADLGLTGFSSTVQNTVPHLQGIAAAAGSLDVSKLAQLDQIKFDTDNLRLTADIIAKLELSFRDLATSVSTGLIGSLQQLSSIFATAGNANFGEQINQLSLGLEKLGKVDTKGAIADNLNKIISVLQRLSNIQLNGVLSELSNVGPALSTIAAAFKSVGDSLDKTIGESINRLLSALRRLAGLNLAQTAQDIPIFSAALSLLADSFRKFAEGAPGEKLPATLLAVTGAIKQLLDISTSNKGGFTQLTADLSSVAAPLKSFAEAIRTFTTGKDISDLTIRVADIKTAMLTLRDAFKLKDIDQLGTKLSTLAPGISELSKAFGSFTSGSNIKNLGSVITTVVSALKELVTIKIGTTATDLAAVAPGITSLGAAFQSFTGGTNFSKLPERITDVVASLEKLRNVKLDDVSASLTVIAKPLTDFFNAFRLFATNEKFGDVAAKFNSLQGALNNLKKLNLAQFSKELQSVSAGLSSLVQAASLVNSNNIDKLAVTFATLRQEAANTKTSFNILGVSINSITAPISNAVASVKNFAGVLLRLPLNIFIAQLKLLKAVFIDLPIKAITGTFNGILAVVNKIAAPFRLVNLAFRDLVIILKVLLVPLSLLGPAFNGVTQSALKLSAIFSGLRVARVAGEVEGLTKNTKKQNDEFSALDKSTTKAAETLKTVGTELNNNSTATKLFGTNLGSANAALNNIKSDSLKRVSTDLGGASNSLLKFLQESRSIDEVGAIFDRLRMSVQQFLKTTVSGAFEATSVFEQLQLQITSLLAKEFVKTGKAGSVQEALGLESLNTTFNETLAIIRQLAIESPFDNTDVVKVYQMANSFGFVREEALALTKTLVDTAAAKGLSGDEAVAIAKVFGQIKSLGKLMSGDVNQLAQRAINVKEILGDVGLSVKDFQKGGRDASEALDIIFASLNRDYAGAGKRAINTLEGLRSTFVSLRDDALRTLFTPLFEALKPFVSAALEPFQNDEFLQKITEVGVALKDNVLGVLLAIAKPIIFLITAFNNLPAPLQQTIILFGKLVVTSIAVSTAIGALRVSYLFLSKLFIFTFSPLTLIISALVTLSITLIANRKAIGDYANYIGGFVVQKLREFSEVIPQIGTALDILTPIIKTAKSTFGNFVESIFGSTIKSDIFASLEKPAKEFNKTIDNVGVKVKDATRTLVALPFTGIKANVESAANANLKLGVSFSSVVKTAQDFTSSTNETNKAIANSFSTVSSVSSGIEKLGTTTQKVQVPLNGLNISLNATNLQLQRTKKIVDDTGASTKRTSSAIGVISTKMYELNGAAENTGGVFNTISRFFAGFAAQASIAVNNLAIGIDYISGKITLFGNFIGGIFSRILTIIQPGIDAVNAALAAIGTSFDTAFTQISAIFNGFSSIATDFGGFTTGITSELSGLSVYFTGFLTEITGFGSGLIDSFASGILASLTVVADALYAIASLVTDLFEAHSPPKILPDMDKWGSELIFSWVDGMVAVIGPALNTLIPLVKSAGKNVFTGLAAIGNFVVKTLLNAGTLLISTFKNIFNVLKGIGLAFVSQIILSLNLLGKTFLVIIDPALTFKEKFIGVFNEIGNFVAGTLTNLLGLAINFGTNFSQVFVDIGTFAVQEFIAAFDSLKFVFPQLDKLTGQIGSFAKKSTEVLSDFGQFANNLFSDLFNNISDYGSGLTESFADGISAAAGAVYDALSAIGKTITYWLIPGSPPKLLPNIDKWGTAAANQFLKGFTSADYSNISEFGDLAERVITTSFNAKGIKTDDIKFDFKGIYKSFAAGLKSGNFGALTGTLGGVDPDLEKLAKTYIKINKVSGELAEANDKVAESEARVAEEREKLKGITEAYDAQIAELEGRISGIDNASTYDAEAKQIGRLQEVINSRYSSEYEKVQAQREIDKIKATQQLRALKAQKAINETNLKAAEKQLEIDKANADGKEKTVSTAEEELNALKAKIQLNEKLNRVDLDGKKIKGEVGDPNGDGLDLAIPDISLPNTAPITSLFDDFKKKLDGFRENITNIFNTVKEKFAAIALFFKPLTDAIGRLLSNTTVLRIAFGLLLSRVILPLVFGGFAGLISSLTATVAVIGPVAAGLLGLTVIIGGLTFGLYVLSGNLLKATGLFNNTEDAANNLSSVFGTIQESFGKFTDGFSKGFYNDEQSFIQAILGFDSNNLAGSIGAIAGQISELFLNLNLAIFKSFTGVVFGKNPIDTFLTEITGKDYTGTFSNFITNLGANLTTAVRDAFLLFQTNIEKEGIIGGIAVTVVQLISDALSGIATSISGLANFDLSTISFDLGGVTITGGKELGPKLAELLGESFSFLNNVDFSTPKTTIITLFTELFTIVRDTVATKFTELMTYMFGDSAPAIVDSLGKVLEYVSGQFVKLYENIESSGLVAAFERFAAAIAPAVTEILKFVGAIAGAALFTILEILPALPAVLSLALNLLSDIITRIGNFFGLINKFIAGDISFGDFLLGAFGEVFGLIGDIISRFDQFGDIIASTIKSAITEFGKLFGIDTSGFLTNFGFVIDIISDLVAFAVGGWIFKLGSVFAFLVEKIGPAFGAIGRFFAGLFTGPAAPTTTLQFLGKIAAAVFNLIKQAIFGFIAFAFSSFDKFNASIAAIRLVLTGLKESIVSTFTDIGNSIYDFFTFDWLTESFNGFTDTVGGFFTGLTDTFSTEFAKTNSEVSLALGNFSVIDPFVDFYDSLKAKNFNQIWAETSVGVNEALGNFSVFNPFADLYDWLFTGEDSFQQQTVMFGLNAFDGYFATASVINPLAFFDEVLPALKILIDNFPSVFDGLLDNINITNPFDGLGNFLFGEDGLVTKLSALVDDFLSSASAISGLVIINPFELLFIGLTNLFNLIPGVSESFGNITKYINSQTIDDIFELVSKSLKALLLDTLEFLGIDPGAFISFFQPVIDIIDDVKQKFSELRQAFVDTANLIPGINLGETEITGVEAAQNKIKEAFGGESATLFQKLDVVLDDATVKQRTADLLSAFEFSYRENSNAFVTDFAAINADLIKAGFTANEIASIASNAGIAVQDGFAEGFSDNKQTTTRAARQLATNTLLELKEALGIQSPSTEARDQIGVFFVQGLLLPFSEVELLTKAANTFVFNLVTLLNSNLVAAATTIQTNISTALFPAFSLAGKQSGDAFVTSATTRLTNADIPVTTSNDYAGQGAIYGKQFGDGLISGINTSVTQSNGIATIFTNALLNIATATIQFSNNIELTIRTLFNGLLQQTTIFFTQLIKEWKDHLNNIIDLVEGFIKSFNKLFEVFYSDILDNLDILFDESITRISDFISITLDNYSDFTDEIVKYTKKGIDDIIIQFERLLDELVPIVTSAIAAVKKAFEALTIDFDTIGKDAVAAFVLQLSLMYEQTEIVLDLFFEQLLLKYANTTGLMYINGTLLGINFIDGWINGLTSRLPTLLLVVTAIAEAVITTTKSTLAISSPSRVMFEMGQYTIDGLSNGITSKIGLATKSMEGVVNAITNSRYKNKIGDFIKKDIFGTINKTIVPELQLSGKSAQNMLIDLARQPTQSFGNADYNKLVSNNMSNSTTNYTTNNNYTMAINTKPDKTIGLRRQFRTMEFIGVK